MIRIVRTRTLRWLESRAVKERIMRDASDNTATKLLNLRDDVHKEMLVAGMPEDATIRDLIRWHREQATDHGSRVELGYIAREAEAIIREPDFAVTSALRIRNKIFVLLGARTPDEQMAVLAGADDSVSG